MSTARQFSVLYNLVAGICGDLSTNGIVQAKSGINTVIKKINSEFDMPSFFKGADKSVYVTPSVGVGTQILTLASDFVRMSNVWWQDNASTNWPLTEITNDDDWLDETDSDSTGDPVVFRTFQPSSIEVTAQMEIWTSPNTGWVSKAGGLLYYSYWAQFAQLVNDSDIPNLPYELDTILVDGGVCDMARQQGDYVLLSTEGGDYKQEYFDGIGRLRAWIIKQKTQDGQMKPDVPSGAFGSASGTRGYKLG
jgi:hypothetical protein